MKKIFLLTTILLLLMASTNNVFAGALTNFSYSAGSYEKGATTTYTINYTTATDVYGASGQYILYTYFPYGFTVNGSQASASVTVNGISKTFTLYDMGSPYIVLIGINETVSAGSNVVIVLTVTNHTSAGSYNFSFLRTAFGGGQEIDAPASIDPIIITEPVPVELTSFTVLVKGKKVELQWNTATEINNFGFEVERRVASDRHLEGDGHFAWSKIGFVEGNGTTNSPKSYSFVDVNAQGKISYRLKQIDRDGKFEYSKEVEVVMSQIPQEFALMQNYPNPFNPVTKINYQLPMNSYVTLRVYDALGREVAKLVNEVKEAGSYTVQLSMNNYQLSSGVYYYTMRSGNFTSTKKLSLMK